MKLEIKNNNLFNYFKNTYLFFLVFTILFGRSFTGLTILGFRLGELMIAFSLIVSMIFIILPIKYLDTNFGKFNFYTHKLIILSFPIIVLLTNGDFLNPYTYQSSAYIWTLGFLLISNFIFSKNEVNNSFFKVVPFFLPLLYILSTIKFPDFLMNFFIENSDKFDFVKASDLLLAFVATNFILKTIYKSNTFDFNYFVLSSAVYLPYLLFKSKGAFFPAVIFIFFNMFSYLKYINKNRWSSFLILVVSAILFLASAFHIYGNFNFTKMGQDNYENINITNTDNVIDNLSKLVNEKNTSQIFASFYIYDGRLYSQEQMADWRLQIWQDVIRDLYSNANYSVDSKGTVRRQQTTLKSDMFYKGHGYNDILPAMKFDERSGTDGTNQNPHNFLIYSFGRGGIIHGLLIMLFHLSIFVYFYKKEKNLNILLFIAPVLMTSFFDASMESVRFPFIYYAFLSIIYNFKTSNKIND